MQNAIDIKRGTTPELPITIETPFENIKHIDFIFKKQENEKYPELLKKSFDFPGTPVEVGEGFFVVNVPFLEEDTRKLPKGEVYMDTRIVYTNNLIPKTEIVELDVSETLFSEVFKK